MMRALLRNLLVVVVVTALLACANRQPNRILLNEDFGLGIKIGDSVNALSKLPPYDFATMMVESKQRMGYFYGSNGDGKRDIVEQGSPEWSKHFKDVSAHGFITIVTQGGVVVAISVLGGYSDGVPSRVSLRGVPLKDINPSRLLKMFPWLEKSTGIALAKNEEMFHYSDKDTKLPNHASGRLNFSVAFIDEKITMLILSESTNSANGISVGK